MSQPCAREIQKIPSIIITETGEKMIREIKALGLAGLLLLSSYSCKNTKEPTANLTGNKYQKAAIIEIYDRSENDSDDVTVLIYDLDGKKGPAGQKTVDEVMIYTGSAFLNGNYKFLRDLPVTEWKHYLAPDADKPLVENNITPMNQEQRDFYSKVLNLGHK